MQQLASWDRSTPSVSRASGVLDHHWSEQLCVAAKPDKPANKSLAVLMETSQSHYEPNKLLVTERPMQQAAMELVAEYTAEFHRLAEHCKLGENLQEALRDRLVYGLRSESHHRQLLAEQDLTLDKALALAQSLETVEENTHTLRGEVSAGRQLNSLVSRQEVSGATGTTLTRDVHKVSPPHKGNPDHGNC